MSGVGKEPNAIEMGKIQGVSGSFPIWWNGHTKHASHWPALLPYQYLPTNRQRKRRTEDILYLACHLIYLVIACHSPKENAPIAPSEDSPRRPRVHAVSLHQERSEELPVSTSIPVVKIIIRIHDLFGIGLGQSFRVSFGNRRLVCFGGGGCCCRFLRL